MARQAKIADIEAAVRYLATRPEADSDRIGGFGICASSGYMVTAAAETPAIKSVALVAPWLQDADVVAQAYGGADGVAKLERRGTLQTQSIAARVGRRSFRPQASPTTAQSCSRCPTTPRRIAA